MTGKVLGSSIPVSPLRRGIAEALSGQVLTVVNQESQTGDQIQPKAYTVAET